jgi:hypothetical protein
MVCERVSGPRAQRSGEGCDDEGERRCVIAEQQVNAEDGEEQEVCRPIMTRAAVGLLTRILSSLLTFGQSQGSRSSLCLVTGSRISGGSHTEGPTPKGNVRVARAEGRAWPVRE